MPVATGERDSQRGAVPVDDQVVLGAGAGPVDGRGADMVPPLRARTCDPSTEQSSRSSRSARRSSVSRAACSRGQTPASVQSRSRRQAITPQQPTVSVRTSRHATPVRSTYMTPARPLSREHAAVPGGDGAVRGRAAAAGPPTSRPPPAAAPRANAASSRRSCRHTQRSTRHTRRPYPRRSGRQHPAEAPPRPRTPEYRPASTASPPTRSPSDPAHPSPSPTQRSAS